MRWKNSTHRCPRCGVLQSHLMLWCSCITIVFPKTATLHVAAIGGSLNAPITRPAPAAGFFVAWPLHVVVCVGGSRLTRIAVVHDLQDRSSVIRDQDFSFNRWWLKLPLASLGRHHQRRTRSRRWHFSSSRPLPYLWRTYISLLCSCLVHR